MSRWLCRRFLRASLPLPHLERRILDWLEAPPAADRAGLASGDGRHQEQAEAVARNGLTLQANPIARRTLGLRGDPAIAAGLAGTRRMPPAELRDAAFRVFPAGRINRDGRSFGLLRAEGADLRLLAGGNCQLSGAQSSGVGVALLWCGFAEDHRVAPTCSPIFTPKPSSTLAATIIQQVPRKPLKASVSARRSRQTRPPQPSPQP